MMVDDDRADYLLSKISELEEVVQTLRAKNDTLEEQAKNNRISYIELTTKCNKLEKTNEELQKKLLFYDHDPIIYTESDKGYDIKYWDNDIGEYRLFASFFFSNLEEDIEEFCKEFVLELKDAYITDM